MCQPQLPAETIIFAVDYNQMVFRTALTTFAMKFCTDSRGPLRINTVSVILWPFLLHHKQVHIEWNVRTFFIAIVMNIGSDIYINLMLKHTHAVYTVGNLLNFHAVSVQSKAHWLCRSLYNNVSMHHYIFHLNLWNPAASVKYIMTTKPSLFFLLQWCIQWYAWFVRLSGVGSFQRLK